MTIKAIIVDDEPLAREGILLRLASHSDIQVIAECANGSDAIRAILSLKPDLVFLDIKMPKVSGFDVVNAVGPELMPAVIFLTAYDEHAIEAFRVHAIDYLLKPVEEARFLESLTHARQHIQKRQLAERGQQLRQLLSDFSDSEAIGTSISPQKDDRLVIRANGHVYLLRFEDIFWVEAEGDYINLHTHDKTHLVRETMKNMQQKLMPKGFQRVHRSHIVNLAFVRELIALDSGDYHIVLNNDKTIKLSRHYRDELYQRLNANC